MKRLVTEAFSAAPLGDDHSDLTLVEAGELVDIEGVNSAGEETGVTFIRPNGERWHAFFDVGDPFISPFGPAS